VRVGGAGALSPSPPTSTDTTSSTGRQARRATTALTSSHTSSSVKPLREMIDSEEAALDHARSIARAEGLSLVAAPSTMSGYKYVTKDARKGHSKYRAAMVKNGSNMELGSFRFAAEAALAVARHLGPEESSALALGQASKPVAPREFGRPRELANCPGLQVCAVSDDDDVAGAESISSELVVAGPSEAPVATVQSPPSSTRSSGSAATEGLGGPAAKRKRLPTANLCPATKLTTQHVILPAHVEDGVATISVAVPVGMRAPAAVTIEWHP